MTKHEKWKSTRTIDEQREYSRSRHQRNRIAERIGSHPANRTLRHRYGLLRHVAKVKQIECTLLFDEYVSLVSRPCFYCGGALPEVGYGLDRINNDAGYVRGNVRPCCHPCNQAKSNFTEATFREWVLRLYNTYVVPR